MNRRYYLVQPWEYKSAFMAPDAAAACVVINGSLYCEYLYGNGIFCNNASIDPAPASFAIIAGVVYWPDCDANEQTAYRWTQLYLNCVSQRESARSKSATGDACKIFKLGAKYIIVSWAARCD